MRLIKSSFEILEQEPGIQGIYKQIERAGRLSYKSEDKITEDSAEKFVNILIKRGHTSCLEHGTVYLYIDSD
jgi:thymidylate synthase (FAD)